MIFGVQVLGVLFAIVMIYLSFLYFKKKEFYLKDFAAWLIVWILFLFAIIFPNTLEFLLQPLTVYRVMDLIIIGGFLVLFIFVFVLYRITRMNEKNVKEIVRKLALEEKK